ncbi:MAG TPA: SRPBCC family protein [Mycobacteriales bacterium]|jgi:carbon monoxide dehydrogenase subunit G|nr:SRPBCC family protein [Mycobacteriales bacterium]
MADEASSRIDIAAQPGEIMAVIADLEAYPKWSTGIKSATVEDSTPDGRPARATFVLDAGVIKDTYTLAYDWTGDDRVEWHLVGGGTMLKSQQGSYTLKASGSGTEVTYRLTVELKVPMLGMFKRKAEKVIIDTALKGLKKRVENG